MGFRVSRKISSRRYVPRPVRLEWTCRAISGRCVMAASMKR